MRIALVNTAAPFVRGGAEILVDDLAEQLQAHGHEVVLYRLPFPSSFGAPLLATTEAARLLCFDEYDRVIGFKFPAYCIKNHAKVIWMLHQFRQVYDLWEGPHGLQPEPSNEALRKIIKAIDEENIVRSRHIYTIAGEVTRRLKQYNKIDSTVLYPPLQNAELYHNHATGDYFFYPSRISDLKRQHLAIEAMRYVKSGVRLVIAGVSEGSYLEKLKQIIREHDLEKQVTLRNEWITDEEKRSLMANSLGVIFIPYREDYGFVSLEASYSAKAAITCTDSGGTLEFVQDGVNGCVVEPTPQAIAQAMDMLYEDRHLAEQMGARGLEDITLRDITWPTTIRRLLL
jgi:glycosyltransferase involved in cell wall biosynthesis